MNLRIALSLAAVVIAAAGPATAQTAPAGAVWLDGLGRWRLHHSFETPVRADARGAPEPLMSGFGLAERREGVAKVLYRPEPRRTPADWMAPSFDDGGWLPAPALRAARTPFLAALHLRGRFLVPDAPAAAGVTLDLAYHGGAVVYVNGREVARDHVAAGEDLAVPYPPEAFLAPDGAVLGLRGDAALWDGPPDAETARRLALRERSLSLRIPPEALRPGVNVLAIRLVRAPYAFEVGERRVALKYKGEFQVHDLSWNTCELRAVRLAGAVPAPAPALRAWNSDSLALDFDLDAGNPAEPLRPVRLAGARNGVFSGKAVVGSGQALRGLRAEAGPLRGHGGTIPADRVQVRYARPHGAAVLTNPESNELIPYAGEPQPMQTLLDAPPDEVPVVEAAASRRSRPAETAAPSAVVPVWITVRVPADAAPGDYEGAVRITAEGTAAPIDIPVLLSVADWRVPDPADFATWIELIQSPETLVLEYGLVPWSDEHLARIARSLEYARALGSRTLYAPLIAESNQGNDHSIVRWVRAGPGPDDYRFDFTILDRYLDVAQRTIGRPALLVLNLWDFYLVRQGTPGREYQVTNRTRHALDGPKVTVRDPATGALENVVLPDFTTPQGEAAWTRLFGELRARMRDRGLEDALVLGIASDIWPTREQLEAYNRITGNLPWVNHSHYRREAMHGGLGPFRYHASYFGVNFNYTGSSRGWANPELHTLFDRLELDAALPHKWRAIAQQAVTANVRGVGRLGADTWHVVQDRRGRRLARAWERFPGADWGYLNVRSSLLAPGPDGPVATVRYEQLREGVQECEARIAIERALADPERRARLGEALAGRCEALLTEHQVAMWRGQLSWQSGSSIRFSLQLIREGVNSLTGYLVFLDSGWQDRSLALFRLAGEVEAARAAR